MKKLLLIIITLSLLCILCMLLTSCAFFGGDIKYELNEDGKSYCVERFPNDAEEVVVDATYDGLPVTAIGSGAADSCRKELKKVTLPDSIVKIDRVFYECEALETINIPSSVKTINDAFYCHELYMDNLESYDIKGQYKISTEKLFVNGVQVKKIEYSDNMGILGNIECGDLEEITVAGSLENAAIYLPASVKVLTIQEGVRSLDITGYELGVEKLIIPTTLESVSAGELTWAALKEIHISDVGKWCQIQFSDWTVNPFSAKDEHIYLNGEMLKHLVIPDYVTEMDGHLFQGCLTIESVYIGEGITELYSQFAFCRNLKSITIGENVKSISRYAFDGCDSLEAVKFEKATGWQLYTYDGMHPQGNIYLTDANVNANILKGEWLEYYLKRGE